MPNFTKIDLKISEELLERVRNVAVKRFDARVHHISGKPEATYTINKLIEIGLEALESGYQPETTMPPRPDFEELVKAQVQEAIAQMEAKTAAKLGALEAELEEVKKLELAA